LSYQVKTEKFEGPMELLLELIEKEKLAINELSLARVAGQYLEFIKNNADIQLDHLADFLSVASKLILIKSRSLLPALQFSDEEEQEIRDLAKQLEEYKKFKEAAQKIGRLEIAGRRSFSREGFWGIHSTFYPPENINAFDLKKYFQAVLAEIPIIEKLEKEFVSEIVTLEEKISDLKKMLTAKIETCFSEITTGAKDKIDVVIAFLAMLEMVKQRMVQVEQPGLFQDIKLKIPNS